MALLAIDPRFELLDVCGIWGQVTLMTAEAPTAPVVGDKLVIVGLYPPPPVTAAPTL